MGEIKKFNNNGGRGFPVNEEIEQRIIDLIYEYDGDVSLVTILGVLDLVKDQIKDAHK